MSADTKVTAGINTSACSHMLSHFLSFQAQINSLEDQLPDEPGPDCLEPISILRFRMPNSEAITRRFLASSPLKVVLPSKR